MMTRGRHLGLFGVGFFILRGLLGLVIPLGLLVLVAFAFYQLGKRSGHTMVTAPRQEATASDTSSQGQNLPKAS